MLTVHLKELAFYSYHGVYEGESKIGNEYIVDLDVTFDENFVKLNNLNSLINYEVLYEIVKKRMAIPSPLLEEVAELVDPEVDAEQVHRRGQLEQGGRPAERVGPVD